MTLPYFFFIASRPSRRTLPIAVALSESFSSTMTSMVALAAAVVIGLPPKVEMLPAFHVSAIATVARHAAIGMPFAMPLAIVMMSGSTPS